MAEDMKLDELLSETLNRLNRNDISENLSDAAVEHVTLLSENFVQSPMTQDTLNYAVDRLFDTAFMNEGNKMLVKFLRSKGINVAQDDVAAIVENLGFEYDEVISETRKTIVEYVTDLVQSRTEKIIAALSEE